MTREYDHLFKLLIIGDSGKFDALLRRREVDISPGESYAQPEEKLIMLIGVCTVHPTVHTCTCRLLYLYSLLPVITLTSWHVIFADYDIYVLMYVLSLLFVSICH
jgi:hypothetical protein